MATTKTVSFVGPYVGRTFQDLARRLVGRDGYLAGAAASDDGTNIRLGPYTFIQGGIVCAEDTGATLPAPTSLGPWFILASAIDDDPATGVALTATSDVSQVGAAVVLAYKANGVWSNPLPVTVDGVLRADAPSSGKEAGFLTTPIASAGRVASAQIQRGRVVDASGQRREIAAPVGTEVDSFATAGPHVLYPRNDHLILRQREAGSEIVHAIGDTVGSSSLFAGAIETGVLVTRPSIYTKRGAGDFRYALAWGNGTALRLASAINLTALGSPTGVWGPLTVYTGTAPIGNVCLAGQRSADGALLVVFTEGNTVRVAAFSVLDGSVVNTPVRIDAQPNACTRVRAVLDLDGLLHVVYQHDEGGAPPNQQIYYLKSSVDAARFGQPAVSPRLANSVNSTNNDTWPSIGVDRQRRAHIGYTTGPGANDFGQLRYVMLDANGAALSRTTYARYGYDPNPASRAGLVDGTSAVDNVQRPQVVVTPHDEVNIFFSAKRLGYGQPDEVGLFQATFEGRLGFPLLLLSGLFPASGAGTDTLVALAATSDERGQLQLAANWSLAGVLYARLDTVLAPFGVLSDSFLEQPSAPLASFGNTDPEMVLVQGSAGGLMLGALNGTAAAICLAMTRTTGRSATPHPKDVYLSGWQLDADPTAPAQPAEAALQVFHTRPKKMSHPILVGDQGDYQGYGSLEEGLFVANRAGGHVVVRGGTYVAASSLVVESGVQLEGEGHALLVFPWAGGLRLGTVSRPMVCSAVGSVVTVSGAAPLRSLFRAGDLCEFFSSAGASTFLTTVRNILDDTRFVVDGSPTGSAVLPYASNVALRHLSIAASKASSVVLAQGLFGAKLEALKLSGFASAASAGLRMSYCRESRASDVDVTGMSEVTGACGISLDYGTDNVIERAVLGDADGRQLQVNATSLNPRILHCGSSFSDRARIQIDPRGSNPAVVIGCIARVDGDVANVVTPVGKVLSSVIGRSSAVGAMQFQDENTALYQAGVPLDLTAPSIDGSRFNGATPTVVVPSVNERVLRAGDAMTGELGLTSLLLSEVADPATPAAGTMRLYLRSNGLPAGQTPPQRRSQLVLLMPDGNALVLAQTDAV
jgi:hypothetical protein